MNKKQFWVFFVCALGLAFCRPVDLKAMKKVYIPISASENVEAYVDKGKYLISCGSNINHDEIRIAEKNLTIKCTESCGVAGILKGHSIMIVAPKVVLKCIIICDCHNDECIIKSDDKIDLSELKLMGQGRFVINGEEYRATDSLKEGEKFDDKTLEKLYVEQYIARQKKKD